LIEVCVLLARGHSLCARPGENESIQLERAIQLNRLAELVAGDAAPRVVWEQRASLLRRRGKMSDAELATVRAGLAPLRTAADYLLSGSEALAGGRHRMALELLTRTVELDPGSYPAQMVLGACYDRLMKYPDATACYTTAIALWPDVWWGYYHRGLVGLKQGHYLKASADFDRAATLAPDRHDTYLHRAVAFQNLKDYPAAIRDLTRALELGASKARTIFMRARVREMAGNKDAAKQDFDEALKLEPTDELTWITRGLARLNADPAGALEDFDAALAISPRSLSALQNKAHILSKLGRTNDAVRVLDRILELYPDYVKARSGRGMMHARAGNWIEAKADVEETLRLDGSPAYMYYAAGIYAQLSRHNPTHKTEALRLLSAALRAGFGHDYIETDKDLDPIRTTPEFRRVLDGVQALKDSR
jgi:eukaryotic-like serine/threonine-protein kinase